MDPLDYLRILRRRWLVVVGAGLVALVAAVVTLPPAPSSADSQAPDSTVSAYRATATLLQTSTTPTTVPVNALQVFASSGDVPKAAAKTLGYQGDPSLLGQRVTVSPDDETGTIGVTVVDADADRATATADAFADALIQYLRERAQSDIDRKVKLLEDVLVRNQKRRNAIVGADELAALQRAALDQAAQGVQQAITQLQVSSATAGFDLEVLQPATAVPDLSKGSGTIVGGSSNRWTRFAMLLVVGLGLGAALALAVERFDTRLRGRMATEAALRLPVVTSVPAMAHRRRGRHEVTSAVDPLSAVAESYRSLRSAVQLLPSRPVERAAQIPGLPDPAEDSRRAAPVRDPRILLFVSASAGEGKTTSLVNLAFTLAEVGRSVIVLDCDFRNPEAHLFLGVPSPRGLSDLLAAGRQIPLASILQNTSIPGVQLAPAGSSTEHPGALMGLVGPLVAEAAQLADIVLIDAPPALVASDAVDLMPSAETAVVVVREGRTGRVDAERLATLLSQMRIPCIGVVQVAAREAGAAYFRAESSKRRAGRHEAMRTQREREADTSPGARRDG